MSRYLEIFVAECRELIESLNLSIVELERTHHAPGTIDEIFRVAHSLKGISATMGYERMAALTHDMEHLLALVRAGARSVDQELITVLLACLDLLEQAVDSIELDGSERIDPASVTAQLQALASGAAAAQPTPAVTQAPPEFGGVLPARDSLPSGFDLMHVHVDVDPGCVATSIRAYMALSAVDAVCETVWSMPSAEELESWEAPFLDLLIVREDEQTATRIHEALNRIPELAGFEVSSWGDDADATIDARTSVEDAPEPTHASLPIRQRRSGTIRVDAERLDSLMHLMGEVVVHRGAVESSLRERDLAAADAAVQALRRATQALQSEVMRVRMVPVETALMRMPRLVRDLSAKLDRQVELTMTGMDTEIDRSVVDALGEPLMHLVRNGIDHGIETTAERRAAGKPPTATLGIEARHEGGNVVITVEDDGRGVDVARVRARAVERGVVSQEDARMLDDDGVVELLFHPGFSTAAVATDVSGRGVGMDAVRAMCREWGGDVEVASVHGAGTVSTIRIPLTLAVMQVLVVRAGSHDVAIPIDRIERTVRMRDLPRADLGGSRRMIRLDGSVLGELDLGRAIGYGSDDEPVFGVIVRGCGGRRIVLSVRALVGEHEAVTRPMPAMLEQERAFMGAAVQGDGSVVLIVDCDQLVDGGSTVEVDAPNRASVSHG